MPLRAIGAAVLAHERSAIGDPERASEDTVHEFRRAMKQWRALMRLLEPFIPDADRWRREARDHARSLAHARDGAAALNAFDGLGEKGILLLSTRSNTTVRGRIEALSPGWKASFRALLDREASSAGAPGNPGLAPESGPPPAWPGFRPLRIAQITP